ncbi:hypothetical protein HZS_1772 [Henneguya salminicola]|nr:hypothetical protein HZS_1772 [Henneguya salminicola]
MLSTIRTKFEKDYAEYIKGFDPEELRELSTRIKRYCGIYGILFINKLDDKFYHHIPITLFPSPFPKEQFQKIRTLQSEVNMLLHRVSNDYEFIIKSLKNVRKMDEFTKKLAKILKQLNNYQFRQQIEAGIIRADYMIDDNRVSPKEIPKIYLIEYNTISVSFGAHGSQIQEIHDEILNFAGSMRSGDPVKIVTDPKKNKVAEDIGLLLSCSWSEYEKLYTVTESCILFIIQQNERNIFDHTKIERYTIKLIKSFQDKQKYTHKLPTVFYASLQDLHDRIQVNEFNGILSYSPNPKTKFHLEVAVVYFRSGYTPSDYTTEDCWSTRRNVELSRAIKIPTIALQLTGTKKIQQLLFSPDIIQKYLPPKIAEIITDTFTGIYSLDESNPQLEELLLKVKSNPKNYVLKPQREGGGNNIYGVEILTTIEDLRSKNQSLSAYILMDIIHPTVYNNYLVVADNSEAIPAECVSELGSWGVYLFIGSNKIFNVSSGYLLRTKSIKEQDGGVASGRAVLDSVCLY